MPSNEKFKKLQATWYKKLKKSGFQDIEQDESHLKRWSGSKMLRGQNSGDDYALLALKWEAKQEYYRLAGHFLHDYSFENQIDKCVWEHHAEGTPDREITSKLNEKKVRIGRTKVQEIIYRLRDEMFRSAKVK